MAGREEEEEDEGTFERWEMGREVEGRGGRASVGRATAIGGGKTRKIAGHPSITALLPRTGVSRHFSIYLSLPFSRCERAFFTFLSSDLSIFFCLFPSVKRTLPLARTRTRAGVGATTSRSFRFENARDFCEYFPIIRRPHFVKYIYDDLKKKIMLRYESFFFVTV